MQGSNQTVKSTKWILKVYNQEAGGQPNLPNLRHQLTRKVRGRRREQTKNRSDYWRHMNGLRYKKLIGKLYYHTLVHKILSGSLVPGLFPEQLVLWESIQDTVELKSFIHSAIDKFTSLFEQSSKGKEKYPNLYLAWLDYIRSFIYQSKQRLWHWLWLSISFHTQRMVTTWILHAIQDGTNGC